MTFMTCFGGPATKIERNPKKMKRAHLANASVSPATKPGWSFLTNHTHILVCLSRNPKTTVRELSDQVGVTERSVQRILSDLEESGVVKRSKDGRCNQYDVHLKFRLRHPLEADHTLGELLDTLT
jgi:DNA-binding MarR family transcriptional regulator